MSGVVYEGWMLRIGHIIGRRKTGISFIHMFFFPFLVCLSPMDFLQNLSSIPMLYFVLENRVLACYKRKPLGNKVPKKTLFIDENCRVEDRGRKIYRGHMAALKSWEARIWKEKIESVIDQHKDLNTDNGSMLHAPCLAKAGINADGNASSSDRESLASAEDEEVTNRTMIRRTTIGNGPPESMLDSTRQGDLTRQGDSVLSNQSTSDEVFSRKHWRLVSCQNGLRIWEELSVADYLPRSCSRAMKASSVVEATCEAIFELVMCMDGTRFEWDSSFQYGSLVEEVDGHTAILYHRLQLGWLSTLLWPRDLCYERYWRRNDDGSYVVLFRSMEHPNCSAQPGFVRAHIESGGFKISPLKSRDGRTRTEVEHLLQIDLKGWGVGYFPSFQQLCLIQMLNSVAGLREWFAQADETHTVPNMPVMMSISSGSVSSKMGGESHDNFNQSISLDEESDEYEDCLTLEPEEMMDSVDAENVMKQPDEDPLDQLDLSSFSGNLRHDDRDNIRDCWRMLDGNNFKVRSKTFCYDKTKVPAGKPFMKLVAIDWFKDVKRMDHVARRQGCAVQPAGGSGDSGGSGGQRKVEVAGGWWLSLLTAASEKGLFTLVVNVQVPGSTHYSMVFYFVSKPLVSGSLLQRFVDGDDEFRNSRFKLILSVPKGSWKVRLIVGSTRCLLGKAVDCTYIHGPKYLEIDIDIGSSTVANGVLGLVFGVISTLVVDMAFLIQANTYEELPERLIGAARVSWLEHSSAIVPQLEPNTSTE
ncbi:protein ENHANCED DISEASE RESISTANCE 2-like isoform X2 [Dendrobium catenatum]|uniref:protein ENHANCED DISEASE RESISTANCE 2-like isoform X2 n=1 Tax=Dendrobium catenatum TaxID=906689 RepID=UPI0010A01489|nr:protein ENHANCED DISEASE RESISTANCE 2-like isoform X2 [Dendrobium catenatum]